METGEYKKLTNNTRYLMISGYSSSAGCFGRKQIHMSIVPCKEILADAFHRRYGVGGFNIVNDLTLEEVLQAAEEARSPVIVQTSVKTVSRYSALCGKPHESPDFRLLSLSRKLVIQGEHL